MCESGSCPPCLYRTNLKVWVYGISAGYPQYTYIRYRLISLSLTSGQQDLAKSQMPDGTSADRIPVKSGGL